MPDRVETICIFAIVFSCLALILVLDSKYSDSDIPSQNPYQRILEKYQHRKTPSKDSHNVYNYVSKSNQQINKCHNTDDCVKQAPQESKTEPDSIEPLKLHSKLTVFVHDSVSMKWYGDSKGYGLFVTRNIKAGEILIVEYPLLRIKTTPDPMAGNSVTVIQEIHSKAQHHAKLDPEFSEIWNGLAMNADILNQYSEPWTKFEEVDPMVFDIVKFSTNHFGQGFNLKPMAIYGLLSKINFGLPQNVAVIFGDEQDANVCVIVATRDIKQGEELFSDYLFDWFSYKEEEYQSADFKRRLFRRSSIGALFGFSQKRYMKLWKALSLSRKSSEEKYKIATKWLYPNGIVGRNPGQTMEIVKGGNSTLAHQIRQIVQSRLLFDLIVGDGDGEAPKWSGKQFVSVTQKLRDADSAKSKFSAK